MDYPKMLFKAGGETECHGLSCETLVVNDEGEESAALADGYAATPQEAHGDAKPAKKGAKPDPEIKVLEEHIAKLDAALVEANARITAAGEEVDKLKAENVELTKLLDEATGEKKPENKGKK